tara:strand:+ start:218 stop:1396 length:1179 start_codon:yes stop_codon:yes gene_type:complete
MRSKVIGLLFNIIFISLTSFLSLEFIIQLLLRTSLLELDGVLKHQNISKKEFDNYLKLRDNDLGWPSKLAHGELFNDSGYRTTSYDYKNSKACIAVFGDSFGYGLEVSNEQAWSNILSEKLGCKIENYSVPAYGTDQAYLRFKKINPDADTVILTFIDDNLRRNFIQFWDLYLGEIYIERTKPRFILDSNQKLRLIPLPVNTYTDIKNINSWKFDKVFKYETFIPNSNKYKTALQLPRFSYVISLFNSIFTNHITKNHENNTSYNKLSRNFLDTRKDFDVNSEESINLHKAILREYLNTCSINYKNCLILRLSINFENPKNEYNNPINNSLKSDPLIKKHLISNAYMAKCMHKNLLEQGLNKENLDLRAPGGHYGTNTNKSIAICLHKKLSE